MSAYEIQFNARKIDRKGCHKIIIILLLFLSGFICRMISDPHHDVKCALESLLAIKRSSGLRVPVRAFHLPSSDIRFRLFLSLSWLRMETRFLFILDETMRSLMMLTVIINNFNHQITEMKKGEGSWDDNWTNWNCTNVERKIVRYMRVMWITFINCFPGRTDVNI